MCMNLLKKPAAIRPCSLKHSSSPAVGYNLQTKGRQCRLEHDHAAMSGEPLNIRVAAAFGDALPAGMRPCCMSGTLVEGTPTGVITQVGGVECYVKEPPAWTSGASGGKKAQAPAILVYPDIFGLQFVNTQLIVDKLAESGFLVVMVNTIKEPALPVSLMDDMLLLSRPDLVRDPHHKATLLDTLVTEPLKRIGAVASLLSNFPAFIARQGGTPPQNRSMVPVIDTVLKEVRAGALGPVGKVGAVGFCFGGGFALLQGGLRNAPAPDGGQDKPATDVDDGLVDAFMVAHTTVKVPEYITPLRRPGLFIAAADDFAFSDEAREKAEGMFKSLQRPCKLLYYPGTFHGFMNRGDPRDAIIQQAQADGIKQTVSWFKTHLA